MHAYTRVLCGARNAPASVGQVCEMKRTLLYRNMRDCVWIVPEVSMHVILGNDWSFSGRATTCRFEDPLETLCSVALELRLLMLLLLVTKHVQLLIVTQLVLLDVVEAHKAHVRDGNNRKSWLIACWWWNMHTTHLESICFFAVLSRFEEHGLANLVFGCGVD